MPFFQEAQGFYVDGGDFKDIAGNHNIYYDSVHNENSHNAKTTVYLRSNNSRSRGVGHSSDNHPYSCSASTTSFVQDWIHSLYSQEEIPTPDLQRCSNRYSEELSDISTDSQPEEVQWRPQMSSPKSQQPFARAQAQPPTPPGTQVCYSRFKSNNPYRSMCEPQTPDTRRWLSDQSNRYSPFGTKEG